MPEPRYAHAAIMIKEEIYVTGGIPDMMHPMGMRSVPMGNNACFKYNLRTASWSADMPELPIGKLYPTLIAIENRFIYQIGGFDDYDYEIYCLDTTNVANGAQWIEIKLRDEIAILKTLNYE